MAPLVAGGKVLVGNSGGEMGVRGWIAALDEGSGKLAWKAYQHRPRQGRADRPAVQALLRDGPGQGPGRQDLAARSVEDRRRHRLGLDQLRSRDQAHLLRHRQSRARGTPTSGPATTNGRPASSPATSNTGAGASGTTRRTPHDLFDHDDINEIILADMPWHGSGGRCCSGPARNGFFYVHRPPHRPGAVGRRRTATSTRTRASTSRPAR